MMGYGLKLAGVGILILLLGILGIWLFSAIWLRIGLGAAIVVVVGGLLLFAWRQDQKAKRAREGLERV
jgi:Flp pilus assembly protein TadB